MIILLIWVTVLVAAVVLYFRQLYSSFNRHGIKHIKPVPIFGNMGGILLRIDHICDNIVKLYNDFPEERFVGRYEFVSELILVRDIELIKKIAVKDFEHFLDHRSLFSNSESYFSRNLFSLRGQEWKDMRSTLSPAFTSSKMRLMVPFMVEVGEQMMQSLHQSIKQSKDGSIDIECKDLTTRYANDVIASCAFGLKVDSHNDKNNTFYALGKETSSFNFRQMMTFFLLINAPALAKLLKLDFLSESSKEAFKKLVLGTMENRELKKIIRPDMIHLLMEAKKGKLTHDEIKSNDLAAGFATVEESAVGQKEINRVWTDEDLVAQAVLFFIAGFETVSSGMSFLLYELAMNPDVQDRLAQEIKENDAKNGGKFDFNSIQNMVYMDMVVSELLRLWPPGVALDRLCTKDYNMGKPNAKAEKDFILRKGSGIWIPVYPIHRDPQHFPNPDKFDPERFSEENKHTINPAAYMPFGVGPRNCIGSRFALCEIKVMAYQILREMEVSPCAKTCIPAKLCKNTFNLRLEGGHWLKFKPRTN
ncbi:cytochrome P450 9e2-like [Spodoptera litura]|uniref:unspecific monooxygenase n=2 Tax=Spodoptera litura TaxID=69820 RepID=A0A9J7DZE0_SPOLT|nr:cytochrome P450 9e2-like [Spodoptera litura]